MTKRTQKLAPPANEQGQITIFFSASLVVMVSIIAFVINIGLFVKAKINLQNATDAAAYAGAAVQSRQLTKLAYLNFEMRNIFKEWMYKYYVIGNLNAPDVRAADFNSPMAGAASYRMESDVNAINPSNVFHDNFNIPSVCIHLENNTTNICRRYAVPGLPEFGSSNLPGAEEASRAFMDVLIGTKIKDCGERTKINMLVTALWAYNVLGMDTDSSWTQTGPAIMAHKQGAWPKAVELAIRMRNLEYVMNREAITTGVCQTPGIEGINCSRSINEVIAENRLGNERISKAFYSGYRNIGGNYAEDEMKQSFTLTEFAPAKRPKGNENSASNLLIPLTKQYEKQFVDLRLMMANFATFYSAMLPRGAGDTSAACDVTKTAIPVPGYPLGFFKNPDVLTYYAVKGEAIFQGMFNPFGDNIKMTAYAAAKPMGGRIGPMLFNQDPDSVAFFARRDELKKRSVPYMSSVETIGAPFRVGASGVGVLADGQYGAGAPLPVTNTANNFWLSDPDSPIGGYLNDTSGRGVQFGIPNLVYDYQEPFLTTGYNPGHVDIHTIKPSRAAAGLDLEIGLFSKFQLARFKGAIGTNVTPDELELQIGRVKAPTRYDAANYLVPTPTDLNLRNNVDSFGFVSEAPQPTTLSGLTKYNMSVYAPLYSTAQTDVLFTGPSEVVSTIFEFMRAQESGVNKYRDAMNQAAFASYKMGDQITSAAAGSREAYRKAAESISDIDFSLPNYRGQVPNSCKSLTGQFLYYYYGDPRLFGGSVVRNPSASPCPNTLGRMLEEYFASASMDPNFSPTHYKYDYYWYGPNFPTETDVFTAYAPGPITGVDTTALFTGPIATSDIEELMRRNFYSTKFIALNSLRSGSPGYAENQTRILIFSEGDVSSTNLQVKQRNFANPIQDPADELNSVKH